MTRTQFPTGPHWLDGDAVPDRANACLRLSMEFSQHALDKCSLYGVNAELSRDDSRPRVFDFLDPPWVAVLTPDAARVITVHPTDQRTLR